MKKFELADEEERSGNVSGTDKPQASQIRRWQKIKKFGEKLDRRVTVHSGRKLENLSLRNGCITVAADY